MARLVNAGVCLQALMVILGHVSAELSLRCGRLFDTTVRARCERVRDLAGSRIGSVPVPPSQQPATDAQDWRTTPTVRTALAGGRCLRAPAQGPCPDANIGEQGPTTWPTSTCPC